MTELAPTAPHWACSGPKKDVKNTDIGSATSGVAALPQALGRRRSLKPLELKREKPLRIINHHRMDFLVSDAV